MKILSKRAAVLLIFICFFLFGMALFVFNYLKGGSAWAMYPVNQHFYTNGQLKTGTITDRNGAILSQMVNGERKYNKDATIRTAVMQTVGDSGGNVGTGAQVIFGGQLSSWNLLNGAYHFGSGQTEIHLTIDADLCATAYKALNGNKGAVCVYNYRTGEILCMASSPSFDPENPPDVNADPDKYKGVYMNRVFSGTYTPGSIFKLVTSAAALDNIADINDRTYHCNSEIVIDGGKITCPESHGKLSFKQALCDSCNVTFAQIADEVGGNTLQKYAELAGFNSSLTINGIETAAGKVDVSNAKGADLGWAGIGQYTDTANPINYIAYVGSIANDGIRVTPRLLVDSSSDTKRILSQSTADTLKDMMRYTVQNNYGDGNFPGLKLCAKTGTAQIAKGDHSDAWFVGFMDRTDCPYAVAVVIENGGSGGRIAGPVANKVLQAAVKSAGK